MPRCPDCNKFVPIEIEEVNETEGLEVQFCGEEGEAYEITGEVRLVKLCEECGTELEECLAEFQEEFDGDDHERTNECELQDPEETSIEGTDSGGGRYQKRMIGASVNVLVKCSCGWEEEVNITAEEAASYFDSLV